MTVQFPAKVQSLRARQRLPPRGSWQNRQVLTEGVQPPLQAKKAAPENGAALLVCDEKKKMKEMAYYLAAFSPSGKMILFTKKKMTMEIPPLSTVVPML